MRALIEAQIAAMQADDWPGAFALASPDLQAQCGTPDALKDDVTAHYAPLPAIAQRRIHRHRDVSRVADLSGHPCRRRRVDDDWLLSRAVARRRLVANCRMCVGASAKQLRLRTLTAREAGSADGFGLAASPATDIWPPTS
jgi:hypothetical protein